MQCLLIALVCLLAAAAAAQMQPRRYYCNTDDSAVTVTDTDFYLITMRTPVESGDSLGMQTCEFKAVSSTSGFLLEIESFDVNTGVLTVISGGVTLFNGSSIQSHETSIVTYQRLTVRFDPAGDVSRGREGVTMRVRVINSNGCPPEWTHMFGNCFGTSATSSRLNFANAQRACNSMQANLLQMPDAYLGSFLSFSRMLPSSLRVQYTWIGLTDKTSAGQYRHYWLNDRYQTPTLIISCASGRQPLTCLHQERCGSINDKISLIYSIYMDNCSKAHAFACSMPPGGAGTFYSIPNGSGTTGGQQYNSNAAWIWGVLAACLFAAGLVAVGVYSGTRSARLSRRAGGPATSVAVSTGRATLPPSNAPPRYSEAAPPRYSEASPPPSYDAAVASGCHDNAGFGK